MEAYAPFIRTQGITELHTPAAVYLYFTFIVFPVDTKSENTVRLNQALKYFKSIIFRVGVVYRSNGDCNFFYRLNKLRLVGVTCFDFFDCLTDTHIGSLG